MPPKARPPPAGALLNAAPRGAGSSSSSRRRLSTVPPPAATPRGRRASTVSKPDGPGAPTPRRPPAVSPRKDGSGGKSAKAKQPARTSESDDDDDFDPSASSGDDDDQSDVFSGTLRDGVVDDMYDPSLMWFATRATQCSTPDVMSMGALSAGLAPFDTSADVPLEVFSVPVADYNAKASQNVEDEFDSDDEQRKGRVTYHSPPRSDMVIVRLGGGKYGFSSDTRLRPDPLVPQFGRKRTVKQTQTIDRRIFNTTKFAANNDTLTVPINDAASISASPSNRGAGMRRGRSKTIKVDSGRPPLPKRKPTAEPLTPAKRDTDTAADTQSRATETPASPSSRVQLPDGAKTPETPALERTNTANTATRTLGSSVRAPSSRKKSRAGLGFGRQMRREPRQSIPVAPPRDPSEDWVWIDGVGNVRKSKYEHEMRNVRPRMRPSSAEVSAAMNEEGPRPKHAVVINAGHGPLAAPDPEAVSPDGDEVVSPQLNVSMMPSEASWIDHRSPSVDGGVHPHRSDSTIAPPKLDARKLSTHASSARIGAGNVLVRNPYEVEERRLPDIAERGVRRAVLPVSEANFSESGRATTARVHNPNPWAGAHFTYDPRRLLPSSPPAAKAREQNPLPALRPDDTLEGGNATASSARQAARGPGDTATTPAIGSLPAARGTKAAPAAAAAAASDNKDKAADAKDAVKTAKQQLQDREREFARMFPDWISNDDRLRPVTRQPTRGARR